MRNAEFLVSALARLLNLASISRINRGIIASSSASPLGSLSIDVQRRLGRGAPGELLSPTKAFGS